MAVTAKLVDSLIFWCPAAAIQQSWGLLCTDTSVKVMSPAFLISTGLDFKMCTVYNRWRMLRICLITKSKSSQDASWTLHQFLSWSWQLSHSLLSISKMMVIDCKLLKKDTSGPSFRIQNNGSQNPRVLQCMGLYQISLKYVTRLRAVLNLNHAVISGRICIPNHYLDLVGAIDWGTHTVYCSFVFSLPVLFLLPCHFFFNFLLCRWQFSFLLPFPIYLFLSFSDLNSRFWADTHELNESLILQKVFDCFSPFAYNSVKDFRYNWCRRNGCLVTRYDKLWHCTCSLQICVNLQCCKPVNLWLFMAARIFVGLRWTLANKNVLHRVAFRMYNIILKDHTLQVFWRGVLHPVLLSSVSPFAGAFPAPSLCVSIHGVCTFLGIWCLPLSGFVSDLSEHDFLKGAHGASLKFLIQVLVLHQDGHTFLPGWQLLSEKTIAVIKGDLFECILHRHCVWFCDVWLAQKETDADMIMMHIICATSI